MEKGHLAELAANNPESIPSLVKGIVEGLEALDIRLGKLETVFTEKVVNKFGEVDRIGNDVEGLKKTVTQVVEELNIQKAWMNDTTMSKVSDIQPNDQVPVVKPKPKNDGMLPADRKAIEEAAASAEISRIRDK